MLGSTPPFILVETAPSILYNASFERCVEPLYCVFMQTPTNVTIPAGNVISAPYNSSFVLTVGVVNTDSNSVLPPSGAFAILQACLCHAGESGQRCMQLVVVPLTKMALAAEVWCEVCPTLRRVCEVRRNNTCGSGCYPWAEAAAGDCDWQWSSCHSFQRPYQPCTSACQVLHNSPALSHSSGHCRPAKAVFVCCRQIAGYGIY